jgi:glycerophosphoryl diester phosphodiesterase
MKKKKGVSFQLGTKIAVMMIFLMAVLSCLWNEKQDSNPQFQRLSKEVHLIGHRGAAGLAPENTLAAFKRACHVGVDAIELDVFLTADQEIVVHHDFRLKPEIARSPDGSWIADGTKLVLKEMTLARLKQYDVGRLKSGTRYARRYPEQEPADGERIPTLRAVVSLLKDRCDPATKLWIEIKTSPEKPELTPAPKKVADAVIKLVRQEKISDRVWILSFDWRVLVHVQDIASDIPTVYLSLTGISIDNIKPGQPGASLWMAGIDIDDYQGSIPRAIKASGGHYWAQYYKHLTGDDLKKAHELGIAVFVWTVDSSPEMIRLVDMGVDGIITNRPDVFHKVMGESPASR